MPPDDPRSLDLTGVRCPVNWARAKARLEEMRPGEVLTVLVDDPRAATDIPRAAEMEGHCVLDVAAVGAGHRITIEC